MRRGGRRENFLLANFFSHIISWAERFLRLLPAQWGFWPTQREILENQQEITTLTVIWARQLVSPQPKLGLSSSTQ